MIIPSYIGIISKNKLFDGGNGSIENPYRITKPYHLDNMRKFPSSHYRLENDIVFTDEFEEDGEYWNDGDCWIPINQFAGLDGQGHKIENLKTVLSVGARGGFVNTVSAYLKDVKFLNFHTAANGLNHIGGIVNRMSGSGRYIEGVFATGYVRGHTYVGGIINQCRGGHVRRCGTNITVVGENVVIGGITGTSQHRADVFDCYSRGSVSSWIKQAGITGNTHGCWIHRCYTTSTLTGGWRSALLGSHDAGYVTPGVNCGTYNGFWDINTTGAASNYLGDLADGRGLTTAEAKYPYVDAPDAYQNWDFDQIWAHDTDGTINDGYPYLRNVTPIPEI